MGYAVYTLFTLLLDRAESDSIWLASLVLVQYNGVVRGTFRLWNKVSIRFKTTDLFSWNAIRSLGAFSTFHSPFFALSSIPATRNGSSCMSQSTSTRYWFFRPTAVCRPLKTSSQETTCRYSQSMMIFRDQYATFYRDLSLFTDRWWAWLCAAILLDREGPGMSFM